MPENPLQKQDPIPDPNAIICAPESRQYFLQKLSVSLCVRESVLQLTFQEMPQVYFLRKMQCLP